MTMQQMLLAAGSKLPTAYYINAIGYVVHSSLNVTCTINFDSTGNITITGTAAGSPTPGSTEYFTPHNDSGSLLWIKATLVSGTLSAGTSGSWLSLSATKSWSVTRTVINGANSVVLTFQIATDSAGTNIVYTSGQVTITATNP